jgi:ribonuclease P protein component
VPGENRFPRSERLTRKRDFLRIYRTGTKLVGPAFVGYVTRQEGEGRKFGFAVSRKVGGAVVRNRIKRYLREIYRTQRPLLRDDVQMVLVARPACRAFGFHACRDAVCRLWEKGRVYVDR